MALASMTLFSVAGVRAEEMNASDQYDSSQQEAMPMDKMMPMGSDYKMMDVKDVNANVNTQKINIENKNELKIEPHDILVSFGKGGGEYANKGGYDDSYGAAACTGERCKIKGVKECEKTITEEKTVCKKICVPQTITITKPFSKTDCNGCAIEGTKTCPKTFSETKTVCETIQVPRTICTKEPFYFEINK